MKLKNILAILFLSILITSCGNDDDQIILEETEISYEMIQEGNYSSSIEDDDVLEDQYLVFKTEEEWSSFYNGTIRRRNEEQAAKFSELDFDFERNNLVMVASGFDETCCRAITIDKVYMNQGRIYVTYQLGDSDNSLEVMSQSYILLEVSKN